MHQLVGDAPDHCRLPDVGGGRDRARARVEVPLHRAAGERNAAGGEDAAAAAHVVGHRGRVRDLDPAERAHDRPGLGELHQQDMVDGEVEVVLEQPDHARHAVDAHHVAQLLRSAQQGG